MLDKKIVKRLIYIFTYEGQNLVSKEEFCRVMRYWAAFTANDINRDNELDLRELNMLMWLVHNCKPSKALIEREIEIMDKDGSNTIDRIEWVAYLAAPNNSLFHLGNTDYYDFEMRELFDEIDENNDGSLDLDELCIYIKADMKNTYANLDASRKAEAHSHIRKLAEDCVKELKKLAKEIPNPHVAPNPNPHVLTWVEFQRYRQVCRMHKLEVTSTLEILFAQQRNEEFHRLSQVTDKDSLLNI